MILISKLETLDLFDRIGTAIIILSLFYIVYLIHGEYGYRIALDVAIVIGTISGPTLAYILMHINQDRKEKIIQTQKERRWYREIEFTLKRLEYLYGIYGDGIFDIAPLTRLDEYDDNFKPLKKVLEDLKKLYFDVPLNVDRNLTKSEYILKFVYDAIIMLHGDYKDKTSLDDYKLSFRSNLKNVIRIVRALSY